MSIADLEATVDRALVDAHFRRVVRLWSAPLHEDYALSADEIDALRAPDSSTLIKLGLDETHAQLATHLS